MIRDPLGGKTARPTHSQRANLKMIQVRRRYQSVGPRISASPPEIRRKKGRRARTMLDSKQLIGCARRLTGRSR
jgi:hypothetical protein